MTNKIIDEVLKEMWKQFQIDSNTSFDIESFIIKKSDPYKNKKPLPLSSLTNLMIIETMINEKLIILKESKQKVNLYQLDYKGKIISQKGGWLKHVTRQILKKIAGGIVTGLTLLFSAVGAIFTIMQRRDTSRRPSTEKTKDKADSTVDKDHIQENTKLDIDSISNQSDKVPSKKKPPS